MLRTSHLIAAIGLPALFAAGVASAAPITIAGSSTGTFKLPSGTCSANQVCGTQASTTTTGSVANGQLYWGGVEVGNSGKYRSDSSATSTLNGGTTTISAQTPASGVIIGSLAYYNGAADGGSAPDIFTASYNLAVTFTLPNASSDPTNSFSLTIDQTTNTNGGTPDSVSGFTLSALQGISINLNGVTVSNLRYVCTAGCGANASFSSASNRFTVAEGKSATLSIEADFTATPEPVSLALLGTGLLGMGLVRARSRRA